MVLQRIARPMVLQSIVALAYLSARLALGVGPPFPSGLTIASRCGNLLRMRKLAAVLTIGFAVAAASTQAQQGAAPAQAPPAAAAPANLPLWAYGYAQPGSTPAAAVPPAQDDGSPKTLQGRTGSFTLAQIRDGLGPPTGIQAITR